MGEPPAPPVTRIVVLVILGDADGICAAAPSLLKVCGQALLVEWAKIADETLAAAAEIKCIVLENLRFSVCICG